MALSSLSQQLPSRIGRDSSFHSPLGKVVLAGVEYSAENLEQIEKEEFCQLVMEGKWNAVVYVYQKKREFHKMDIKRRGTALHVAVNNGNEEAVAKLVNEILNHERNEALRHGSALAWQDRDVNGLWLNEQVATPLHHAARRGFTNICKCIVGDNGERKLLIEEENEKGETPLFWAVLNGKIEAFDFLQRVAPRDLNIQVTNKSDTILHAAIRREFFNLATVIIRRYPLLSTQRNDDLVTPLEVLATKPSAFKNEMNLSWWKQILYHCISLDQSKIDSYLKKSGKSEGDGNKEEKQHPVSKDLGLPVLQTSLDSENVCKARYTLFPPNWVPCVRFSYFSLKFVFHWPFLKRLRISGVDLTAIQKMKQKHFWGRMLFDEFMKNPYESYIGSYEAKPIREEEGMESVEVLSKVWDEKQTTSLKQKPEKDDKMETGSSMQEPGKENKENEKTPLAVVKNDIVEIMKELNTKIPSAPEDIEKKGLWLVAMKKIEPETELAEKPDKHETAYLAAAKTGIVEIVSKLQDEIPSVIHDTTSNKENVLLVAVKNKQPYVVDELKKKLGDKQLEGLIYETDDKDNNVLHLAAGTLNSNEKTWQIAGAAMQMMWDIKWYQYINELVPEHFAFRINKAGKTPGEIFKEQHKELLKDSSVWLKETSESCSVVAALIAGVSFATASNVPGGTGDNGKPPLEGQPAFDAFAIASLVGLCFSVTALIMFLAILTSRKQAEDFNRSLPTKLLIGLSSLFVSIASMLIAFCAGHFFVLKDKFSNIHY